MFALIAQTSCEGIVIIDRDSRLVFVNPAAAKLFGYTPEELSGASLTQLMPEESRAAHLRGFAAYLGTGTRRLTWQGMELTGLHRSGRRVPLEITLAEARYEGRIFFAGFIRDLTERHWSHARLAVQYAVADILSTVENESQALTEVLKAIGEHLGFAAGNVWLVKKDRLQWLSAWHAQGVDVEAFETASRDRTFGKGEGLPGRAWESETPTWITAIEADENFPRARIGLAANLHSGLAFPLRSGTQVFGAMEFFSTYVRSLEPTLIRILTSISQQITQFLTRRRAQQALEDTETRHKTLFENANDALGVSANEQFIYANQAFAKMFGYDEPDELIGVSIYQTIPDTQKDIVREHRRRRSVGLPEPMQYESRGKRKDGSEFPTEIRATDYWIDGTMYTLAIMRDTTREREAREILTQSNAALTRANNDLEQFAYAASHDLQEPLRLIILYSQLLHRRHGGALSSDGQLLLQTIMDSARRINELVKDLLSYTNVASLDVIAPALTDPSSVLVEVEHSLQQRILEANATITRDKLPTIRVHRTHLFQLFQNLISNSVKYCRPGIAPRIHVASRELEDGMVELQVQDNGIGIAPEYHDRVFGVFKRLHAPSVPGTGIGLAICKKIVEHYGGKIWVESAPDAGSTFHFTVPAGA